MEARLQNMSTAHPRYFKETILAHLGSSFSNIFSLQFAPKVLIFIVFNTFYVIFAPWLTYEVHLATGLRTRTYDFWLFRAGDLVENCHTLQSGMEVDILSWLFLFQMAKKPGWNLCNYTSKPDMDCWGF